MTDPGPFAPPSGALPPRPADSAGQGMPLLPPPSGPPIDSAAPVLPVARRRRRRWLVPVIVGGALVFLALAIGVGVLATRLATAISPSLGASAQEDAPPPLDSPLSGDPGSPVAAEPLTCAACFTVTDAQQIGFPRATYDALGLPVTDGFVYETTVGADQIEKTGWWSSDGGTPDACYFAYTPAPLYLVPGESAGAAVNDDEIYYPDQHRDRDERYVLTESFRVFDDTAGATAHLAAIEGAVAECSSISFPGQGWSGTVVAAPALDLPPSVAAYGWSQGNAYTRYYSVVLQRGNLVARLGMWTDAEGATESEFRTFAGEYAAALAELVPRA